jgi:hypothetical protein
VIITVEVTPARLEQVAEALIADRDTHLQARREERSQPSQLDTPTSGTLLEAWTVS